MDKNLFLQMQEISHFAGERVDYTQGGGGNTSLKLDDKVMLIKASGFRLCDVTTTKAIVAVDYKAIANYYNTVDPQGDHESESSNIAKQYTMRLEGLDDLRPSVEVGFHSILKKYVIHTHSVYANIICCAKSSKELLSKIFGKNEYSYVLLPSIKPGFTLTVEMIKALNKKPSEVIFMQNHGLVVHADTIERVKELQNDVNEKIMKFFGLLQSDMGSVRLEKIDENKFESKSVFLQKYLEKNSLNLEFLDKHPLYPDQLVYLNNCLRNDAKKMIIENGKLVYNTSQKEAATLEETLLAYLFVISNLKKNNLEISIMAKEEVDFINNWEAEKFRRSIGKK